MNIDKNERIEHVLCPAALLDSIHYGESSPFTTIYGIENGEPPIEIGILYPSGLFCLNHIS